MSSSNDMSGVADPQLFHCHLGIEVFLPAEVTLEEGPTADQCVIQGACPAARH